MESTIPIYSNRFSQLCTQSAQSVPDDFVSFEGRIMLNGANAKIIALVNCIRDTNTMCPRAIEWVAELIYRPTRRVSNRDVCMD